MHTGQTTGHQAALWHQRTTEHIRVDLFDSSQNVESIHLHSTWPGFRAFMQDKMVRNYMELMYRHHGIDHLVRGIESIESDLEPRDEPSNIIQLFGPSALYKRRTFG